MQWLPPNLRRDREVPIPLREKWNWQSAQGSPLLTSIFRASGQKLRTILPLPEKQKSSIAVGSKLTSQDERKAYSRGWLEMRIHKQDWKIRICPMLSNSSNNWLFPPLFDSFSDQLTPKAPETHRKVSRVSFLAHPSSWNLQKLTQSNPSSTSVWFFTQQIHREVKLWLSTVFKTFEEK